MSKTPRKFKSMASQRCWETEAQARSISAQLATLGYSVTPVFQSENGWFTFKANVDSRFAAKLVP